MHTRCVHATVHQHLKVETGSFEFVLLCLVVLQMEDG